MENPLENSYDVLDNGKAIFTRECQVCHGCSARGEGPYRTGLEPLPPDLGDGSYGDFTDGDYIWRLEVGVPWSAMPAWGLQYSIDELWTVVHYIRTMFTQTEPTPAEAARGRELHRAAAVQGADDAGDGVVRARQGALRQHVLAVPRAGGQRPRPGRPVSEAEAGEPAGPGEGPRPAGGAEQHPHVRHPQLHHAVVGRVAADRPALGPRQVHRRRLPEGPARDEPA